MKNPITSNTFFVVTYEQKGRLIREIPMKYSPEVAVSWLVDILLSENDPGLKKAASMSLVRMLGTAEPVEIIKRVNDILKAPRSITPEYFREVYEWRLNR